MYPNLEAEIARSGLLNCELADYLGLSKKSFYNKRKGLTEFTVKEIKLLHSKYFPNLDLEYLFATGPSQM